MLTVETRRLQLVAMTPDQLKLVVTDLDALGRELRCTVLPDVVTPAAHRAVLVKIEKLTNQPVENLPWFTYWMLIQRQERLGIGMAGFKGSPGVTGEAEIGYGTAESQQGKGYMTEAVQELVRWALEQPECRAVVAETLQSNLASRRVLEKSGFSIYHQDAQNVYWMTGENHHSVRTNE